MGKNKERLEQYEKGMNRLEMEPPRKDCHWIKNLKGCDKISHRKHIELNDNGDNVEICGMELKL